MQEERLVSKRKLRKYLNKKLRHKYGTETVNHLQGFVESIVDKVLTETEREFESENSLRKFHSLRKRKIIDPSIFLKVVGEVYIQPTDKIFEEIAKVREPIFSKADIEVA